MATAADTVAALVLRPVKEETEKMKMRARDGAGERWRVKGLRWPAWPHGAGRQRRVAITASTRRPCPGDGRPLSRAIQLVQTRDVMPDSGFFI